jgi:hypothetical protein
MAGFWRDRSLTACPRDGVLNMKNLSAMRCFKGILTVALATLFSLEAAPCRAQGRVEVEAAIGEPFGVGRITIGTGGDFRVTLPAPLRNGTPRRRVAEMAKRVIDKAGEPR